MIKTSAIVLRADMPLPCWFLWERYQKAWKAARTLQYNFPPVAYADSADVMVGIFAEVRGRLAVKKIVEEQTHSERQGENLAMERGSSMWPARN